MLSRHRKIVIDKIEELATVTHDLERVMKLLYDTDTGLLNDYMINHLKKYHELRRRNKEFYLMMLGRGPKAFDNLVLVLRGTENFRAEELLCDHKISILDIPSSEEPEYPPMDELDLGPSKDKGNVNIVVKKHPDDKFMDCPVEGDIRGTYRMRSKPRGHALIINIFKTAGREDRNGSDVDHSKLQHLFQQLGFVVFPRENLTDDEIRQEIAERKADPVLVNIDCLVVFVMCHGRQNGRVERSGVELLASNNEPIDSNWITGEFQCPALRRKPKLFFFQSCRTVSEEIKGTIVRYRKDIETDSDLISSKESYQFERDYEDTFLGFATIPGKASMRDRATGAWFVDAFCEVIAEHACTHDLDDLWSKIDNEVRKKSLSQTPELCKRGFNKRLFFNPHLYR